MIDYKDNDPDKKPINIYIGEEEWCNYSFENKVRLLYRLKQSLSPLAKETEKSLSMLVEKEKNEREIDYEATYQNIYGDVSEWPE
ncbi:MULTISPECIES: hypothetical protein [Bacillus subtilis group]|uniref:hypothetical protein n=1 Tax=Bacillus subtilis group TaxID=653685 RepID=UPI001A930ED2|nr:MULTISPECIES: hypothetical protein [Bacillus subtilis group]MCY9308852.1 hypothetical protein [Bacillus inaquosorum]BCT30429.1 hypothetical protein BVAD3_41030 [Bacillus velezensis]